MLTKFINKCHSLADDARRVLVYKKLYSKYKEYTMVREEVYVNNLSALAPFKRVPGCVVECGTWRGGMIAGIAEVLGPDRRYFLFDSYEGLPPAKPIDGEAALAWQENKTGAHYFNNCTAEIEIARRAMEMSGAKQVELIEGWFNATLPNWTPPEKIAILRLDCDWFDSMMTCLESLYPHMSEDGIILVDDYYTWDGCSRAVHEFLARHRYAARIIQLHGICGIKPNFSVPVETGEPPANRSTRPVG